MNIKKKIFPLLLCLIVCLMSFAPAFAGPNAQYITDERGLIGEEIGLNQRASSIYDKYELNVCVYLCSENYTDNLNDYAKKLYKDAFAGEDGLMFVENGSKCGFYASGKAAQVFTQNRLSELIDSYNNEQDYTVRVFQYLEEAEKMLYSSGLYNVSDDDNHTPRLVDDAGLLSASEKKEIEKRLDEISKSQECDVVLVTVDSLGNKTAQAYADDFYDYRGYGMGQGDDGILLLLSMEDRDYAFSTYGFGITAFNDTGLEKLEEDILPLLGDNRYYDAFSTYADSSEKLLIMANEGTPYGVDGNVDKPSTEDIVATGVPGAAVVGIGGSGIATLVKKSRLKTVRRRYGAGDYVVPGSMVLDTSSEYYLYNQISKTPKPKENSSGGSSMHTSSSGRSHGGSSGKF